MRLFGLIGYPLSHSFSKKYFDQKFLQEKITDTSFENFSIENISLLHEILKNTDLEGLAITIPYKKAVMPFLNIASEAVQKMGACNCISIKEGKLYGHNTDVIGFERSFIQQLKPQHKQALILGTGGAAAAVEFVLQKLKIPYHFVSRKKDREDNILVYEELNETVINHHQVIINCSPLGTFPKVDGAPDIPYQFINKEHYLFDLVYNPAETMFLQLGKQRGAIVQNGYDMLVFQAEENWKIWNS